MPSVIYRNERACGCICMIHACIYIHSYMDADHRCVHGSPMCACATYLHTCASVCVCARARVLGRTRIRAENVRALPIGNGPRADRLAGVQDGVGVQREHRRVEHRSCVDHAKCMRRLHPAARHCGEARSAGVRCGVVLVRGGAADDGARARGCARAQAPGVVCVDIRVSI